MPERVFLDTNILVYSRDETSMFFEQVCEALQGLTDGGVLLCISQQVLREYACVVTRQPPRGFGASVERALKEIREFEAAYEVLLATGHVWITWKDLIRTSNVTGLLLHDAYIAAIMVEYGITNILTLNSADFEVFQGVQPVEPSCWKELLGPA